MGKLDKIKCIRMDASTLELLQKNLDKINEQSEKANKKKMNESAYIRDLIHRAHQENLGFTTDEFAKISRTLAGIGNNINQIAHNTNMQVYNQYDAEKLREGLSTLADIKQQLAEIRKKV